MIEKTKDGYKFDFNNISEKNTLMLNELPRWIVEDTNIYQRHIATLRQIVHCYCYTLNYGKYTWEEIAEHIKDYYSLEGKNQWYYNYLLSLKEE